MGIEDQMDKKIEEFNEYMLKQAAITFSMEGASKDLKSFLLKKLSHNRTNLYHVSEMVAAVAHSPSKEIREGSLKKGTALHSLLEHVVKEVKFTDMALDLIIQNLMVKETMLASEKDTQTIPSDKTE